MKKEPSPPHVPKRSPFNWAEWLVYGAIALWVFALVPLSIFGWPAIYKAAKHEAVTAWVQAFGVLIGIGVAIWVPWLQRRQTQRDALLGAASLAAHVRSLLRAAHVNEVWSSKEETDVLLMSLKVAAQFWASVRLEILPAAGVPAFVAMIALTEEAIALCRRQPGQAMAFRMDWLKVNLRADMYCQRIFKDLGTAGIADTGK